MSKERELLEKALKECGDEKNRHHISVDLYRDILKLLDEPNQEQAVAWIYEQLLADGFSERTLSFGFERDFDGVITPLYAQPLKRKPLSDDDIAKLWGEKFSGETLMIRNFARAIEKAHGIGE